VALDIAYSHYMLVPSSTQLPKLMIFRAVSFSLAFRFKLLPLSMIILLIFPLQLSQQASFLCCDTRDGAIRNCKASLKNSSILVRLNRSTNLFVAGVATLKIS